MGLLSLTRLVWGPVSLSVVLGLAVTACYALQGALLAVALATVVSGQPAKAVPWVVAAAIVVLIRAAVLWASEIAALATGGRVKAVLRSRLFAKLDELGPGITLTRQTGDVQTAVVAGVEALDAYYGRYLPALIVAAVGCTAIVLALAAVDWRSAGVLALFVVLLPIADALWLRWRMPTTSGIFAAMGAFAAFLLDSLQGLVTLKAFDVAAQRRNDLARRAAVLRRESMSTLSVSLMRGGLTGFISLGGVATVLAFDAWRVAAGGLAPVVLFLTLLLAREAFRPIERLERAFHTAWSASGAVAPIQALLHASPAVEEPEPAHAPPARFDVTFDAVTFTYPGAESPALDRVSFTVDEGAVVALVGPSGAGKTTVGSLLLRFFDPEAGSIRIGGVDIRELKLGDLRSLISLVAQDTFLFHGSIEDNLRLAQPTATADRLRAAGRDANIDDFIQTLPQGYATPVGERGTHLSGGQRQRIAIARALLKDAPILVLDEATSSVDPAAEQLIQATLSKQRGHRTTLIIAHRLSTILKADRIVVLDGGHVAETGTHGELINRRGLYARLVKAQEVA